MEAVALLGAYLLMRAFGQIDGLTGPGGLFPGIDLGRGQSGVGHYQQRAAVQRLVPRTVRPGVRGTGARIGNLWDRVTDRLRLAAERRWDQLDADRASARSRFPEGDVRPWSRRMRDQHRTCPECRHGGLSGHRWDCPCSDCLCAVTEKPRGATPPARPDPDVVEPVDAVPPAAPTPSGGDGSSTPTDPTDPNPGTPGPKENDMSAPLASVPTGSGPVAPGAPAGGTVATSSTGGAPVALDPSDVRFSDARRTLAWFAAQAQVMRDGLNARQVDPESLGKIADLSAQATALIQHLNSKYRPVEDAVNQSRHVAAMPTYRDR